MTAPRLEIDLDKIHFNARTLVERLEVRGISITGVTKAALGSPKIAEILLRAGIRTLGDSRIENIEAMRRERLPASITLIRSPMLSQIDRVVANADISCNSELKVIHGLSAATLKTGRSHGVLLMVELGDLREGILPDDLENAVRETLRLPGIVLKGIGTNLACQSGVSPDARNMAELSGLADSVEKKFNIRLNIVSGGNSGNIAWVLSDAPTGRINNLRLGESILLGCEPLHRRPIDGLYTDAFTLVAEVIESKMKPSQAWGEFGETAFGERPRARAGNERRRTILAIGRQDVDPGGLCAPAGIDILGASSDHLLVNSDRVLDIGTEIPFNVNYGALLRTMTSPFVAKAWLSPRSRAALG